MNNNIINKLSEAEKLIQENNEILGSELAGLKNAFQVLDSNAIDNYVQELDDQYRLLNIGILGKVKAGKSSLLNATFFDGEDVLPKAATPMTASLTVLTGGDSFKAIVEFFSKEDIEKIENCHKRYEEDYKSILEKEIINLKAKKNLDDKTINERAARKAARSITNIELRVAHDQYKKMLNSGKIEEIIHGPQTKEIIECSRDALMSLLKDYVGTDGDMMPFTKSVTLEFPTEELKNIAVIDTPGLNDPVASRSQRTLEYLHKCDVVFIVSPAGQFLSGEDMALMDRLSNKQGIHELYLVASQADNQLFGDIVERSEGNFNTAINILKTTLSDQANDVLSSLCENNPEVSNQFDQLLKESKTRTIISSSICYALNQRFNNRDSWDSIMDHIFNMLQETYPDFFNESSAILNLKKLDGIADMKKAIADTRAKKDTILSNKKNAWINTQEKNIENYLKEVEGVVRSKLSFIMNTDLADIERQKNNLESIIIEQADAVDDTYENLLDSLCLKLREFFSNNRTALFTQASGGIRDAEGSETRTRHWTTGWLFWKKDHYETYTVSTVRTGAVKGQLSDLLYQIQENVSLNIETFVKQWKEDVRRKVINALQDTQNSSSINGTLVKTALRRQLANIKIPDFDISDCKFKCSSEGILESDDAVRFLDSVGDYIRDLRTKTQKRTDTFISDLKNSASNYKLSELIFTDMRSQLITLQKELNNKQVTVEKLQRCLSKMENINNG